MARRLSRLGNQIHSRKHIIQFTPATVGLGAITVKTLANAKEVRTATDTDVEVGAKIHSVYLELWLTSDDAAQGAVAVSLEKVQNAASSMTYAQSVALNDYDNKHNVFYVTEGLVPPNVQSGIPFVRGWFKIPAGKQRMALGEYLTLNISGITNGATYCGMVIYKEYN